MPKTYRYIVLHDGPDRKVTVIEGSKVQATLATLQKLVDGYIEALPPAMHSSLYPDPGYKVEKINHIYVNEEGKYRSDFQDNMHFNLVHSTGYVQWIDPVKGPAVIEEVVNA